MFWGFFYISEQVTQNASSSHSCTAKWADYHSCAISVKIVSEEELGGHIPHAYTHINGIWSAFVVYCTLCEHCPIWSCFPAAGCGGATRPRLTTPTSYEFDKQLCGFTLLLPVKQRYTHTGAHTHTNMHTPAQQYHHLLMWHITRVSYCCA